ncbi:hypothetical protein HQ531_15270, partial [bacterium]|nr:hypothetical protein [bacterium]
MDVKETVKSVGYGILGIGILVGFFIIALIFIEGGVWVSEKILPILNKVLIFVILINVLILGPLSIGKKTIYISFFGFQISSYIFGATLWFMGLISAYYLWGVGAIII